MKELPNPTFPLSQLFLSKGSLHRPDQHFNGPNDQSVSINGRSGIAVTWARHLDEDWQSQRIADLPLRYRKHFLGA